VVAALVGGLALALLLLLLRSSLVQEARTAGHQAEATEELQARVNALERALARRESTFRGATPPRDDRPRAPTVPNPEPDEDSAGTPIRSETEPAETDEQRIERRLSLFEAAFLEEPRDPGWSRLAEGELHSILSQPVFERSSVEELTCQSMLCRLKVRHQDARAESVFIDNLSREAGLQFPRVKVLRDDWSETPVSVAFLARELHGMPAVGP
jgi:hypothetical protein